MMYTGKNVKSSIEVSPLSADLSQKLEPKNQYLSSLTLNGKIVFEKVSSDFLGIPIDKVKGQPEIKANYTCRQNDE